VCNIMQWFRPAAGRHTGSGSDERLRRRQLQGGGSGGGGAGWERELGLAACLPCCVRCLHAYLFT
jgi:hypothetical protein